MESVILKTEENGKPIEKPFSLTSNMKFLVTGLIFGIVLMKSEVVSWYRIQEMFRFQSFHMYGVIGSAVGIGILSMLLVKKFNVKTVTGETIQIKKKEFSIGTIIGGLLFGFGWAMTGACPGPMVALMGSGSVAFGVALLSAIGGTWVYGALQSRLPH